MKNKLIGILTFLIITTGVSQTQIQIDSISNELCKTFVDNEHLVDSINVSISYSKHLFPYLEKFPKDKREDIGMNIYFRLQRNCKTFLDILNRDDPPKGDWETITEKPSSDLNKSDCELFLEHSEFKYYEGNGDIVRVTIKDGFWIDHFLDGTFSKLKFKWINECEFEIEFIESSNYTRNNFSKPGDKYIYQLLSKLENYYDLSVEIPNSDNFLRFKLYY